MRSRNKINGKKKREIFYNALGGVVFGLLAVLGASVALAFTEPTTVPSITEPTSADSVGQIETSLGTPNSVTTGTDTIFGYLRLIFTNMGSSPVAQTPNGTDSAKITDLLGTSATVANGKTVFNFLKAINDGVADFPSIANVRSIDTVAGVSGLIGDCVATNDTGQCYITQTTKSALDTDLVTTNIRAGVNIFGVAGDSNVVNTSSGTAAASQILSGLVAWVDGASVTGTMANVGAQTITPSTSNQTITTGYHNGTGYCAGDADLIAANIKSGANIFGVAGDSNVVNTSSGTAAASQILSGLVAWVDGASVTGTMANVGAQTITPSTSNQTITTGYHNGTGYCAGDADLIAANIKSGANIFGVAGDSNVVNTSSGTAVASQILSGLVAWVDGASVTGTMANCAADNGGTCYVSQAAKSTLDTDLVAANIKSGVNIFGVAGSIAESPANCSSEGQQSCVATGSYYAGTSKIVSDITVSQTAGYYPAFNLSTVDTDLATGNIKSGTTIFGVAGDSNVVNTSTGTAVAGNILSGLVAWVDGTSLTGTMTNVGQQILTPTTSNQALTAGYHNGTGYCAGDADLIAANIKSGANIFGVAGSAIQQGEQIFTSSGTWTRPSGVTKVSVVIIGGGGGGGGGGAGVIPYNNHNRGANGTTGGSSSFNGITANGGVYGGGGDGYNYGYCQDTGSGGSNSSRGSVFSGGIGGRGSVSDGSGGGGASVSGSAFTPEYNSEFGDGGTAVVAGFGSGGGGAGGYVGATGYPTAGAGGDGSVLNGGGGGVGYGAGGGGGGAGVHSVQNGCSGGGGGGEAGAIIIIKDMTVSSDSYSVTIGGGGGGGAGATSSYGTGGTGGTGGNGIVVIFW